MKSPGLLLAALLALGAVTPNTAKASLVLEYSSVGFDLPASWLPPGSMEGWSFTTNNAVTVTALDAWNPGPDGTEVSLYSVVPGDFITGGGSLTVLATAFVSQSDPVEGSPTEFNSHSITPVALEAGARYYITETVGANNSVETTTSYSGVITDPSIHYGYPVGGYGYPTDDLNVGAFGPGYFGPNFDIAPQTPEPTSLLSLAGGLALLALFRRHRKTGSI